MMPANTKRKHKLIFFYTRLYYTYESDSRHHFLEWMISERPLIISCKYYNPSKWDKWLTRNFYIFIFQGITWGCAYKVTGDSALEYLKQRECTLGKSSQWLDNFCTSTLEVISIHLSRKMLTTDCLSVVFVRRLLFNKLLKQRSKVNMRCGRL